MNIVRYTEDKKRKNDMNFSQILVKIFGDKKSRDLKAYQPLVALVTDIYPSIQALSNDELRARTKSLQQRIRSAAKEQQDEINSLKASIPATEIQDRAPIFAKIDQLEKEVLDIYEKQLDLARAEAFAIVKSTAERFAHNENIEVTATDFDRELAATHDFVDIVGDKAVYHNHWVAGGNETVWDMVHFDVQLFGGTVLHQGKIAEMFTGEGKTLTAVDGPHLHVPRFVGGLHRQTSAQLRSPSQGLSVRHHLRYQQ